MSYYIAPHSEGLTGNLVIYRVVERLRDFKPEEDKLYRVFKSKKEMKTNLYADVYQGVNGKLKKSRTYFALRF